MDISELTLRLALLFLPGIICSYTVRALTVRREPSSFFFVLASFAFGFSSYFLYWVWLQLLHLGLPADERPTVVFFKALTDTKVSVCYGEIVYACVASVVLGLLVSVVSTYKVHFRLARLCKITNKFADLDVWGYAFNATAVQWATIRDHKNDLVYDGWVQAFSEDSRHPELLLRDVSIYVNSTGEPLYQVGAMYLSRQRTDVTIEFRTVPVDPGRQWKEQGDEPQEV